MREAQLAAVVVEERSANQVFQTFYLMRDGRLRPSYASARGCKASGINDGNERSE